MLGNRISQESLNFITELYIDCTELQVEIFFVAYPLWNPRFATVFSVFVFWSLLAVASTALEDPAITESQQKIQPSLLSEFVQVFSSG